MLLVGGLLTSSSPKHEVDVYARFMHLTRHDGLPDNTITSLCQDKERYMWIGTRKGLVRFDGHEIRVFVHQSGDSTSLPGNYITDIKEDWDGTIWVATKSGLAQLKKKTGYFTTIPIWYNEGKGISHPYVRALYVDTYPYVWIETVDGNLHQMHAKTYESKLFPHDRITQEYYDYHSIFKDKEQRMWIGGRNLGPMYLDPLSQTFKVIDNDPRDTIKKRDRDVACYFQDSKRRFWVSATDGFYHYDLKNDVFSKKLARSTYDIAEGDKKCLWLATGNGLVHYNPSMNEFINYRHTKGDPLSLVDNHVKCVLVDLDGNIWAGTREGISVLNKKHQLIRQYRTISSLPNSLSHNKVTAFYESNDGQLYVGTDGGGLNRMQKEQERFMHYQHIVGDTTSIASNRVSAIEGAGSDMWIGLWQGVGFNHFDPANQQFTRYALSWDSYKRDWYNDLWCDNNSMIWCGVWGGHGIHWFDTKQRTFLKQNLKPRNHPADDPVYRQFRNKEYTIFFGAHRIIYLWNTSLNQFSAFWPPIRASHGISIKVESADLPDFTKVNEGVTMDEITYVLTDHGIFTFDVQSQQFKTLSIPALNYNCIAHSELDHEWWLGSERGLEYMKGKEEKLFLVEDVNDRQSALYNRKIMALQLINKDELLVGTSQGLLIFNPVLNQFDTTKTLIRGDVANEPIMSIHPMDKKLLFVFKRGFAIYDQELAEQAVFTVANSYDLGMRTDQIFDVHFVSGEELIYLATDRGVMQYSVKDERFFTLPKLDDYTVYDLDYEKNQLTLCTNQGLLKYIVNTQELIQYNKPTSEMLSSHLVKFVEPDSKGNVWIGTTDKGINKLNGQTNKIEHYFTPDGTYVNPKTHCFLETKDGDVYIGGESVFKYEPFSNQFSEVPLAASLPETPVLAMLEDDLGFIWLVSENYLMRTDTEQKQQVSLHNQFGLQRLEYTGAAMAKQDGSFLIGTKQGFLHFNPSALFSEENTPKVSITAFSVLGEENERYIGEEAIVLNYDENFFKISFSDMVFDSNTKSYEYKLEGVDKNWRMIQDHVANYTKIAPGRYVFEVRNAQDPTHSGSTLRVIVKPPFWKSWWFYTAVIITLVLLMILWWRQRLHRVQMLEYNLDLKQRLLLSQLNPHFIFNALIAIQNFIFKSEPHTAGSYLSKFAKLMRLYLTNMRSDYTLVADEVNALTFYLDMQKLRFNSSFDYQISLEGVNNEDRILIPTMMIQPLVENAVEHGMKNLQSEGMINVYLAKEKDRWKVVVEDNGSGLLASFPKKDYKSLSTEIIKERIAGFNIESKGHYLIKIENKSEMMKDESGLRVTMFLPLKYQE
jgi:ligand-binding sensor domain-containing protein